MAALGIEDRFHLLGQAWGGMLGAEFMMADDAGKARGRSRSHRSRRPPSTCSPRTPPTHPMNVERILGSRSHVCPDFRHVVHIEEPEAFLSMVGGFLLEHG